MDNHVDIFFVEGLRQINLKEYMDVLSLPPKTFYLVTEHKNSVFRFLPLDSMPPTKHMKGITISYLNHNGFLTLPNIMEDVAIGDMVDVYCQANVLYISRFFANIILSNLNLMEKD